MKFVARVLFIAPLFWPIRVLSDEVVVMRHGEAQQNVAHILNSDVKKSYQYPLTPTGMKQVKDAARFIAKTYKFSASNVRAVYTSPLWRTVQTARLLAQNLGINKSKIIIDERLRENGMGDLEGHPESELDALDASLGGNDRYLLVADKKFHGETKNEIGMRLQSFLASIKSAGSGNVIIITHGTPAAELLEMFDKDQSKLPALNRGEFRIVHLR